MALSVASSGLLGWGAGRHEEAVGREYSPPGAENWKVQWVGRAV